MRIVKLQTDANRRPGEPFRCGIVVAAVVLLIAAGGCGGGSSSPSGPSGPPAATPAGPANIAGRYTLNIRTSTTCAAQVSRTWNATITQVGSDATVDVSNVFLGGPFTCGVQGTAITCPTLAGAVITILENFPGPNYLQIFGTMQGTASSGSISGRLNGQIGYPLQGTNCSAADHQFTFNPR